MPLRPDAPAFVPSNDFKNTQTIATNQSQSHDGPSLQQTNATKNSSNKKPAADTKRKERSKKRNIKKSPSNSNGTIAGDHQAKRDHLRHGKKSGITNQNPKSKKSSRQNRDSNNNKASSTRRRELLRDENVSYKKENETQQEQPSLLELDSFPLLGGSSEHENLQEPSSSLPTAWSSVAAPLEPAVSEKEKQLERVSSLLSSSMRDSGLTLLSNNRTTLPHQERIVRTPTILKQADHVNTTTLSENDSENGNAMESRQLYSYNQVSAMNRTTRFDMSKLRNRWWELLQKSAEMNRMQRDVHDSHQSDPSSNSDDSDLQEEFVELPSMLEVTNINRMNQEKKTEESMLLELDGIDRYIECSHPLHLAILNDDEEALQTLLMLPRDKVLTSSSTQCLLKEESTCWSPLQLAAKMGNAGLLRLMLREVGGALRQRNSDTLASSVYADDRQQYNGFPTALMISVQMGHEECVQVFLSHSQPSAVVGLIAAKDKSGNNALHHCCGAGICDVTDKIQGRQTTPSILRLLLETTIKAGGTTPSKVLSAKNDLEQTPLHVACQNGSVDLVEIFLSVCGGSSCFSVLVKVFETHDKYGQTPLLAAIASGCTDLVMTLMMRKGNHHHHRMGTRQRQKASRVKILSESAKVKPKACCPLVWAVMTSGKLEMVRLLLEFHAPSFTFRSTSFNEQEGYQLTRALQEAVLKCNDNPGNDASCEMIDILQMLVESGANPCEELETEPSSLSEIATATPQPHPADAGKMRKTLDAMISPKRALKTALGLAAESGHAQALIALLDSAILHQKKTRNLRRKDPALQKQPESFFRGLEAIEGNEMKTAFSDALVLTLYWGCKPIASIADHVNIEGALGQATNEDFLKCSLALYCRNAELGVSGLARLKCSMDDTRLKRSDEVFGGSGNDFHYSFRAGYTVEAIQFPDGENDADLNDGTKVVGLKDRSRLMQQLPWMKELLQKSQSVGCQWLQETRMEWIDGTCEAPEISFQSDLIVIVTENGTSRLLAHGSVVSQKSAKLAAAIRFAKLSMKRADMSSRANASQSIERPKVEIDLPSVSRRLCVLMLQHLYHGSIVLGLRSDASGCCQDLLELLLLSEEILCPSLTQECEMRLLSSKPFNCFCWSCNRATTYASNIPSTWYGGDGDECVYLVEGPSKLIQPKNVLDVISVAHHLEDSQFPIGKDSYGVEFSIHLGPSTETSGGVPSSSDGTSGEWTPLIYSKPMVAAREVAVCLVLRQFMAVILSDAFAAQVGQNFDGMESSEQKSYANEAAILLLQMCLDEAVISNFNGSWSLPAFNTAKHTCLQSTW